MVAPDKILRPTVVLLHGVGIDAAMWQPQLDGLADALELYAPNLPGFGAEETRVPPIREAADLLAADLESRGFESVHLCGLSLGGMVAIALAARHPALVRGLVVSGAQMRVSRLLRTLLLGVGRVLPERALLAGSNLPASAGPEMRAAEERLARRLGKSGILSVMRAAAHADLTDDLRRIRCPTLVLCGGRDNRLNRRAAGRIAAAISGAELQLVPEAGHVWNVELPDRFNAVLLRFVRDVEAPD